MSPVPKEVVMPVVEDEWDDYDDDVDELDELINGEERPAEEPSEAADIAPGCRGLRQTEVPFI